MERNPKKTVFQNIEARLFCLAWENFKKFDFMSDRETSTNIKNVKIVHLASNGMLRILVGLFSLFWGCFLFTGPVEALRLKTNWGERVDLSEKIIRGQVGSVKSYWNTEKTLIYTDVTIRVDEYLKGDGERKIMLHIPGGKVGNKTQWVSDTPQFCVKNHYVILLESSGQVTAGPDGVYRLKGKDGDRFLHWLRAYIAGDPKVSKEGPPMAPRLQPH